MNHDDAIAELLRTMSKGQYLVLALAIRAAGGELRINPDELASLAMTRSPRCEVDATDGAIVIRLVDESSAS